VSGIEWCDVPAGPFTMGSDPAEEHAPDTDEAPAHRVACPGFRIGRTPVTNAEYRLFVEATARVAPSCWDAGTIPEGRERHPVTYVSWADAAAFCRWAGGFLPSEAQWERASRGDDRRTWPWGDEPPTPSHARFDAADTAPVALSPGGASPFGALDLAGNVWEWTRSAMRPYPYAADDGREDGTSAEPRVVRGGSFIHGAGEIRCSYRHAMLPAAVDHYVGFRLAADPDARLELDVDTVDVPPGDVLLGNDPRPSRGPASRDEVPQHDVVVAAVSLSRTPVTNGQYREFVRATGHPAPPHWPGGALPVALDRHPVTYVDWLDATAFCRWAGARLPTEAEWEKAARGTDRRLFPWGDDDTPGLARHGRGMKHGSTSPVGAHPDGASAYGLDDMAGNVWEWVSSVHAPYPYDPRDGREDPGSGLPRVLRGGSYASPTSRNLRCAARSRSAPGRRSSHIGFRAARPAA
jgi:formylglycine-generating enzyme required for sulfatase activity